MRNRTRLIFWTVPLVVLLLFWVGCVWGATYYAAMADFGSGVTWYYRQGAWPDADNKTVPDPPDLERILDLLRGNEIVLAAGTYEDAELDSDNSLYLYGSTTLRAAEPGDLDYGMYGGNVVLRSTADNTVYVWSSQTNILVKGITIAVSYTHLTLPTN